MSQIPEEPIRSSIDRAVHVRPLCKADWENWCALWKGYLAFYKTEVGPEMYETSFTRMLSDDDGEFNGLVAETSDGVLVGLVHYLFHRHGWKIEKICYLQDLFVSPEARGMGAGRALIEGVYGKADEAGCPTVYWNTQDFNHEARKLYDKIGRKTPFIKYTRF